MASNAVATITDLPAIRAEDALIAAEAAVTGDWSKLRADQRIQLYGAVCTSMGLNPLTQPFGWFSQGGKLVLYAYKGATDQLRKLHGVDVISVEKEIEDGLLITTVQVRDSSGRTDMDVGAVPIDGLKGEARANAIMKSITKAKRRATLSLVGLGILDESELETIRGARRVHLDMTTGEILGDEPIDTPAPVRQLPAAADVRTASDRDRDQAKSDLWKLANGTWGWSKDTLDAVAMRLMGSPLTALDAAGLTELYRRLVTTTSDERDELVRDADAANAIHRTVEPGDV